MLHLCSRKTRLFPLKTKKATCFSVYLSSSIYSMELLP
uniref:Uncharacterized protein n=1 Tax=Arundo donax TaxID=35708 RepID=A0A0A8ZUM2_ARUDO